MKKTRNLILVCAGGALAALTLVQCKSGQSVQTETAEPAVMPQVDYVNGVKPVVDAYCITCHSGDSPAAGIGLTTYEDVRNQTEHNSLLKRIHSRSMPMPPTGLISPNERKIISAWAKSGYIRELKKDSTSVSYEETYQFNPPTIKPIDINFEGFEFMKLMQGHWIGKMNIMGQKYSWFAFDYRAISPTHVHGIYEGGTIGNLFTMFFVTNFKGVKTIMARNGGILNGIYRTSYFVLNKVDIKDGQQHFEFVDAYGGKDIMWMELTFKGENELDFNSYTSRFGSTGKASQHMKFQAKKHNPELAEAAAKQFSYPQETIEKSFEDGLPMPNWGKEYPVITSASFIYTDREKSLEELAKLAGDPYTISDIPHLARLTLNIEREEKIKPYKTLIYLSRHALTDKSGKFFLKYGFLDEKAGNSILTFPELSNKQESFTFTYLHPGEYYLTVVADVNNDGYLSVGDISSTSKKIMVAPKSHKTIVVKDVSTQN